MTHLKKYSLHIISVILVIALSITVYFYQYNRYSINQWQLIINRMVSSPEEHTIPFYMVLFSFDGQSLYNNQESFFNSVKQLSHENKIDIFTTFSGNTSYRTQKSQVLLQSYSNSTIGSNLSLLDSTRRIDFSDFTDQYYTSNLNDPYAYNYIEFLNPIFNTDSFDIFEMHQMIALFNILNNLYPQSISLQFWSTQYPRDLAESFQSKLSEYGDIDFGTGMWAGTGIDFRDEFDLYIIVSLLFIIITLVTFIIALKKIPEIAVRKSKGNKHYIIFKRLFFPLMIVQILIYAIVQIIMVNIISGPIRNVTVDFYITLYHWYLILLFVILMIYFAIIIIIQKVKYSWIKRNVKLNQLILGLLILKICFTVTILPNLVIIIESNHTLLQARRVLTQKQMNVDTIYSINWIDLGAIDHDSFLRQQELIGTTFNILSNYNLLYTDITTQFWSGFGGSNKLPYPFAIVNRTILQDKTFYTLDGNNLKAEHLSIDNHYFIVPYNYEPNLFDFLFIQNAIIIHVKETPRIYSLLPDDFLPVFIDNPIIALINQYNPGDLFPINALSSPFMQFSIEDDHMKELLTLDLENRNILSSIQFSNVQADIQRNLTLVNSILDSMIMKGILYLIIITLMSFVSTALYMKSKIRYLSVLYMKGFDFRERYGTIFLVLYIVNLIAMLILAILNSVLLIQIILILLFLTIFETVLLSLYIIKSQKKAISSYIKWM